MNTLKNSMSPKQLSKRDAIINSAINVFARKGYMKAKISDVAKKAEVADGTVYLYFKNKDDLLINAMREMLEDKLIKIRKKIAKEATAREKLFKFAELQIDLFMKNPDVVRFMVVEIRQSQEFYKKYPSYGPMNEFLEYVETLVKDAIEEGSIRKIDPKTFALMIMGTTDFALTQWALGNSKLSLQEVTTNFIDIVRDGLRIDSNN
ncbi:MAG TPA: TetR/AcrR family transcriptional regulator [Candidatus Cloacimonadota bacterium]|nr:TetR/AcrR family transcriptional regulator [Candidatus Cloacimonadota bacterium]HPT70749.1 TetR/AcrR family transcriptional regulator [Candidatus Cloacimonadota bacterium]